MLPNQTRQLWIEWLTENLQRLLVNTGRTIKQPDPVWPVFQFGTREATFLMMLQALTNLLTFTQDLLSLSLWEIWAAEWFITQFSEKLTETSLSGALRQLLKANCCFTKACVSHNDTFFKDLKMCMKYLSKTQIQVTNAVWHVSANAAAFFFFLPKSRVNWLNRLNCVASPSVGVTCNQNKSARI